MTLAGPDPGRRIAVALTLLLALLVVSAAPVEAVTITASVHTTDGELSEGSLNGFQISGSGKNASAIASSVAVTIQDDDSPASFVTTGDDEYQLVRDHGETWYPDSKDYQDLFDQVVTAGTEPVTVEFRSAMYSGQAGNDVQARLVVNGTEIAENRTAGNQLVTYTHTVDPGETERIQIQGRDTNLVGYAKFESPNNDGYSGNELTNVDGPAIWMNTIAGGDFDGAEYVGGSHAVDRAASGFVNLTLTDATATITWEAKNAGGSWAAVDQSTYSSSGNRTISLSDGYEMYRVRVSTSSDGSTPFAQIDAEGVLADRSIPTITDHSPSNDSAIDALPVALSVTVDDDDLGAVTGESVDVRFFATADGRQIGATTVTEDDATASVSWSNISSSDTGWYAVLEDSANRTTRSANYSIEPPDALVIRDELTGEVLTTASDNVEIQFSQDGELITRNTSNGEIPLFGVPIGEGYEATIRADGYHTRTAIVSRGLVDQATLYALPTSANSTTVEFSIEDFSGQFASGETAIVVEKPIEIDGQPKWQIVASNDMGAVARFPATLEQGTSHRIILVNDDGIRRNRGEYVPTGETAFETIRVEEVKIPIAKGSPWASEVRTSMLESGELEVVVAYNDSAVSTTDYRLEIYERGSPNSPLFEDSWGGPRGDFSTVYTLPDAQNTSYIVEWSAVRDGSEIGQTVPVGATGRLQIPFDTDILGAIVVVAFVFIASLGSERWAPHIALTIVGFTGMIMLMQIIHIHYGSFWIGLLIAMGGYLNSHGGRR